MRQSLHLERPQEMHHFYWGVDAHSRPQTPPPPTPNSDWVLLVRNCAFLI